MPDNAAPVGALNQPSRAERTIHRCCVGRFRSGNSAVEDFTAGATHDQPTRRQSSISAPFDERVRKLVADWGPEKSPELIEEMIITALKMARDKMGTGDLKLMNRAPKEIRFAAKIFCGFPAVSEPWMRGSRSSPLCRRERPASFQWCCWIGREEVIGKRG